MQLKLRTYHMHDISNIQIVEYDKATSPIQNNEKLAQMQHLGCEVNNRAVHHGYTTIDAEHDYDEPYFEPASEVDALLEQLKELAVSNIPEKSLRLCEVPL